MPSAAECAWLAGLFDGEGSVILRAQKWQVQARVTNSDILTVERAAEIAGEGGVYLTSHRPRRRAIYTWVAASGGAERALRLMLPYLVTKREQADLALEAIELRRVNPRIAPERFGLGGPRIAPETHVQMAELEAQIKALRAPPQPVRRA